jgi:hypothetical protein
MPTTDSTTPMPPMPPHKPPVEQEACCIIGACCDKQKRIQALADQIQADLTAKGIHITDAVAMAMATAIRTRYDLAPAGLLQPLIDNVSENVRAYPEYETS